MAQSQQEPNQSQSKSKNLVKLLQSNARLLSKLRFQEDPQILLRSYDSKTMNHKLCGFLEQDRLVPGLQNEQWRHRLLAEETFIALNSFLHRNHN